MSGRLRVIALAIIIRPTDGAVLAIRFPEPERTFYRAPGGGVEFGERAVETVQREMLEELGHAIRVERLLGVIENHFSHRGLRGHEVVFNYLAHFEDESLYSHAEFPITEDNGDRFTAYWVQLADLERQNIPYYPFETAALIRSLNS
jgi:ADP-ribose pyrophosphatase YjhB (NUDIX family)